VVVADVRRRADRRDSVLLGLGCHGEGVLEITRAIVDSGEDVAMKIDHGRDLMAD
jgi:hypothetical protein